MILKHYICLLICCTPLWATQVSKTYPWPPKLPLAKKGTLSVNEKSFLYIPSDVIERAKKSQFDFDVARKVPLIEFAYHGDLPPLGKRKNPGWSIWGDICVASDGTVYSGIGDHGNDIGGDSSCLLYAWYPGKSELVKVADLNAVVPRLRGEPTWAKLHARIDEGKNGKIYLSATLNSSSKCAQPMFKWSKAIPGGQLYVFDPKDKSCKPFVNLPEKRVTVTSLLDRERNIWWCTLAPAPQCLYGIELDSGKVYHQTPNGSLGFDRNIALSPRGDLIFNGSETYEYVDTYTKKIVKTSFKLPGAKSGMRASTRPDKKGNIYGITHRPGRIFRMNLAKNEYEILGSDFLEGNYTTVVTLSPDEKYLYYLPGAHGRAWKVGTPVVQFDIAKRRHKVICFLNETLQRKCDYVPGGTYGIKLSGDGATLFINMNGHATAKNRQPFMRENGFGLTSFIAVHIPESERS